MGGCERQKLSDMIFERSLTRAFEMTLGSGDLPELDYLAIYHDSKHKSGQQDNHTEEIDSKLICSNLSIYLMLC